LPAGPVLRSLAAVKRHLALVGNDTMPQPSSTASSQPAAPAPRDPRFSTVGPATPSNASRPKAGLLHVVGYLKKTLQLDASLSARGTLSESNALLGLAASDGQTLREQATALLEALGVNPETLTVVGVSG